MDFIYDSSGRPYAMVSGESTVSAVYYYVLNQQGDVIRVTGAGGTTVAEYTYNAWGKLMDCSGWLATTNPIRYRGYYYDNETGFYYLQSRYYDPTIGRFINADQFASTGQDFLGYNMFIYCNNNPVMHNDPTGEFGVATLCVIGGLAGGLINYASEVITNYREGCRGADAWVNNVNWGGVAASAFSGALSAIPGAGPLRARSMLPAMPLWI